MPRTKETTVPEHTISEEKDASLLAAANDIFAEDIAEQAEELEPDRTTLPPAQTELDERVEEPASTSTTERAVALESTEDPERVDFRPRIEDMVTVRGGGLYLPVRRRVGWMRGEPRPHPDWSIDTVAEEVIRGTIKKGAGRGGTEAVEGGYARYRANIFDETGRLIATGTKTEYSERFTDFAEKAETGAIGRALAIAGYGTEAAIDLDEGLEKERIADAPVTPSRPINITASAIPGVRPGGRPAGIQPAQIQDIGRLNRSLGLGLGIVSLMESIKGTEVPPIEEGKENETLRAYLETFTHEEAGQLIQHLTKALKEQQAQAAEAETT
jgi:hypothetical protein